MTTDVACSPFLTRHQAPLLVVASSIWLAVIPLFYYRRLWRMLAEGPPSWDVAGLARGLLPLFACAVASVVSVVALRGVTAGRWRSTLGSGAFIAAPAVAALSLAIGVLRRNPALPAWNEALARGVSGILGAAIVLVAAFAVGHGLFVRIGPASASRAERGVFNLTLGLSALSYCCLALAALHLYAMTTVCVLIGVELLTAAPRAIRRSRQMFRARRFNQPPSPVPAQGRILTLVDSAWLGLALLAVLAALVGALAPESEFDALWYHLWLPKIWLQQHRLTDMVQEYISLYPGGYELVFGAGLAAGNVVAAKLLHFACLPTTAALVWLYARRFTKGSPWLAAAIFVTMPTVLWEATTAYVDLALTLFVAAGIYALHRAEETRERGWFLLAVLSFGFGACIKHLALVAMCLASLGVWVSEWRRTRSTWAAAQPALLLAGGTILIALPWYAHAWLASGNPVFPEMYKVFGAYPTIRWDGVSQEGLDRFMAHFGDERTPLNLVLLPWNLTMHASRYAGTLGPIFLMMLPAFLLPGRRSRSVLRLLLFVTGYLIVWASPISSFQLRFVLLVTPWLSVAAASAVDRLAQFARAHAARAVVPSLTGVLFVMLLLNQPPFITVHEGDRRGWDGWLVHVMREAPLGVVIGRTSERAYLEARVPSFAAWQYINAHLDPDARVMTFSEGDNYYSERQRLWVNSTMARPAMAPPGREADAFTALDRLAVSHVLIDRRALDQYPAGLAIADAAAIARYYEPLYDDGRFAVYRLR